MLYGPFRYIFEYEVGAAVFLTVIMFRYFGTRRFPNQKNRLFSVILWVTFFDLLLDIIGSQVIENALILPHWINYSVNSVFYALQVALPMLMTGYARAMKAHLNWQSEKRALPLYIPGLLMFLLLIVNPINHWIFYVDPKQGYLHRAGFLYIYVVFLFYMAATFVITFHNRKKLRKTEVNTIYSFLIINFFAMIVQFYLPALLITGPAITLSVVLMYFTIQNPKTMQDSTGAFTYEAMLTFLHDRVQENDPVKIVAVRITNMHRINELLGIENGSLLLRQICQYLQNSTGDSWVFRMRGSCLVDITGSRNRDPDFCRNVAERIHQPWIVRNTEIMVQATICCIAAAELLDKPITAEEAVNFLDTALLQNEKAKRQNRIISVGPELITMIERNRVVETALREALETGQWLELHYQPLWSSKEQRFTGAEALLRFRHPTLGNIPPDEFIPIAESNGLISTLDEFVVRKVCAFLSDNDLISRFRLKAIEINLSALEFMQRRFPERIHHILSESGVDPRCLIFEITETTATESFELLNECMSKIRTAGCCFALDDFGTGYANISQVIQLPFSMVKLDRSLLYGSKIVLEDMTRMFTRMGIQTVAEGIETAQQAEMIHTMKADYIQGYYYAKPMSEEKLVSFLTEHACV